MAFITRTVREGGVIRYDGVDWKLDDRQTVPTGTKVAVNTNENYYRGVYSIYGHTKDRLLLFKRER